MSETAFSVEPEVDGDDYRLRVSGELDLETCKRARTVCDEQSTRPGPPRSAGRVTTYQG
jgi:hypothetical protein